MSLFQGPLTSDGKSLLPLTPDIPSANMKLILHHVSLKRIILIFLCYHCHFSTCLGSLSQISSSREQETELNLNGRGRKNDLVVPAANGHISKKTRRHRLTSNDVNSWVQLGNDIEGITQEDGYFGEKVAASGDGLFVIVGAQNLHRDDDDYDSATSSKKVPQSRLLRSDTRKSGKLPKSSKTTTATSLRRRSLKSDGYASVYHYEDGEWAQFGDDFNGENYERCGEDVAINNAGDRIFIGCPNYYKTEGNHTRRGRVKVYQFVQNNWEQLGQDIVDYYGGRLGETLAVSKTGNRMVAGVRYYDRPGVARIFEYDDNANEWVQLGGNITGSEIDDRFGESVDISGEGNDVIIGAPFHDGNGGDLGLVRIYRFNAGTEQWNQIGNDILGLQNSTHLGTRVAISADGSRAAVSSWNLSDKVQIFVLDDSVTFEWKLVATFTGERNGDYFGSGLDMSDDGHHVIVGALYNDGNAINAGHAIVYNYDPIDESWSQLGTDLDGDLSHEYFGESVAISNDGRRVVIGVSGKDINGVEDVGLVRVFEYSEPSQQPSASPSVSPSAYPTQMPSTSDSCTDSPLRVVINRRRAAKTCKQVSRKSAQMCKKKHVKTHCPNACDMCFWYDCSDSKASFIFEKTKKDCKWLRDLPAREVVRMCRLEEVMATCRDTCAFCE